MERLKQNPNKLILTLDQTFKKIDWQEPEIKGNYVFVKYPSGLIAPVFGFSEEDVDRMATLQRRDNPNFISKEEFDTGSGRVVRIQVGHFHSSSVSEIQYYAKDGKIDWMHRSEGYALTDGHVWYGEYPDVVIHKNPHLRDAIGKDGLRDLENRRAGLINYWFYPYHHLPKIHRFGEASCHILYLKRDESWKYISHMVVPLGEKAGVHDDFFDLQGYEFEINPFGRFRIPQEIFVTDLIKNMFYPNLVEAPWVEYDWKKGESRVDFGGKHNMHEYVGIEKI